MYKLLGFHILFLCTFILPIAHIIARHGFVLRITLGTDRSTLSTVRSTLGLSQRTPPIFSKSGIPVTLRGVRVDWRAVPVQRGPRCFCETLGARRVNPTTGSGRILVSNPSNCSISSFLIVRKALCSRQYVATREMYEFLQFLELAKASTLPTIRSPSLACESAMLIRLPSVGKPRVSAVTRSTIVYDAS